MNIEEQVMYYVIFHRGFLIVTQLSYFFFNNHVSQFLIRL